MTFRVFYSFTLAAIVLLLNTDSAIAAEETEPPAGLWLRQLFDVQTADAGQLSVHGQGTASVYLNGQRLLRNTKISDAVQTIDVGDLLRTGRNSICVALSHSGKPQLSVSLKQEKVRPLNGWKGVNTPPPVGWQQTDFNDRDWKATPMNAAADRPEKVQSVTWRPPGGAQRFGPDGFSFRDGDHVVLLGGTFIERAQQFGHLECALNSDPQKRLTFRNLGWSADTVFAESRGIFDTPEKGYERLIEHVRAEEPDVVLLSYGQNEAMSFAEGQPGRKRFYDGLTRLIADLKTTGAELVLLSPHPLLPVPDPLPDASRWNSALERYAATARDVARATETGFVDLYDDFFTDLARHFGYISEQQLPAVSLEDHPQLLRQLATVWTDNGMHWNDAGYAAVGPLVAERLFGADASHSEIHVDPLRRKVRSDTGQLSDVQWLDAEQTALKFHYRPAAVAAGESRVLLDANHPTFSVTVASGAGADQQKQTADRARVVHGDQVFTQYSIPRNDDYRQLNKLVRRKNELYFHRWRPQNITYLFGFRKHEQGNNASEIAQFDPLVDELESRIQQAKQPSVLQFTLTTATPDSQ